jgi:flagellar biosynthesis protein FlhA
LEAGYATLDTVKRVRRVLESEPEVLQSDQSRSREQNLVEALVHNPLTLVLASNLTPISQALAKRIEDVRKHIAREVGLELPSVRMQHHTQLDQGVYQVVVQGKTVGQDRVDPEGWLVVAPESDLKMLDGERCGDPTYGIPSVWVAKRPALEDFSLSFDAVSVICTHLTERVRAYGAELLGVDELESLMKGMQRPTLVRLIEEKFETVLVRKVLRNLLRERLTIRPLPLILEALLDCVEDASEETLTESARRAVGWFTCSEFANAKGEILAVTLESTYEREVLFEWDQSNVPVCEILENLALELLADGRHAVLVTIPALRPKLAERVRGPGLTVLSTAEVDPAYRVVPWITITREGLVRSTRHHTRSSGRG